MDFYEEDKISTTNRNDQQVYDINQIILDNEYTRVIYVGLVKQGNFWEIKMLIENKVDKPLTLKCKDICLDDFRISEYSTIVRDLPGYYKAFEHASMMFCDLEDLGIENIEDMYNIKFSLICEIDFEVIAETLPLQVKAKKYIPKISNMKKLNEIFSQIYPKKENGSNQDIITKENKNIFENDFFKLICKGIIYIENQWKIKFIIENKIRNKISVGIEKLIIKNQIVDSYSYIATDVNPEEKTCKDFYLKIDDLGIENIEDIDQITLSVFYEYNGTKSDGDLKVIIYPADYSNEIYTEMNKIINKINKGVIWDDLGRSCESEIEFEFIYPNGKHGDIDMYLISQEGKYEKVSDISYKANLKTEKLDVIEIMVLFYYMRFSMNAIRLHRTNNENAINFLVKHNNIIKLDNLYEIAEKETRVVNVSEKKIKDIALEIIKKKYKELLAERDKIYNKIVANGESSSRWVSEQQLYAIVKKQYNDAIFQYKAEWLGKQSLDIYIPSIKLAIEYQGKQHFEPIEIFDGEEGFKNTQIRDRKKKSLCVKNGVKLLEWKYDVIPNEENLKKIMGGLDMNFRDELNEICRTPEEVAAEKSSKEYKEGAECATYVHSYIKDEIRKRVKNGEYEIIDRKKHVKFYTDKDTFPFGLYGHPVIRDFRVNKSFFNKLGDYRVKAYYNIFDIDYYHGFMDTFTKLIEEDHIHVEIIGFYDKPNSIHNVEFVPTDGVVFDSAVSKYNFSILGKCEITF